MKLNRNNLLRVYDKAVVDWLKSLPLAVAVFGAGTAETILVRPNTSDKAFGEGYKIDANTQTQTDLPEIAVTRMSPSLDLARNVKGTIKTWSVNSTQGAITSYKKMEAPKPYTLPYQIDIRAESIPMMNQMLDIILYELSPQLVLDIPLPDPFKTKYGTVNLQGVSIQPTPVELGEGEVSIFTTSIDVAIDGWLYQDKIESLGLPIETVDTTYQKMDGSSFN